MPTSPPVGSLREIRFRLLHSIGIQQGESDALDGVPVGVHELCCLGHQGGHDIAFITLTYGVLPRQPSAVPYAFPHKTLNSIKGGVCRTQCLALQSQPW
jgi:hypothetical protein